jgi:hypothetical protein
MWLPQDLQRGAHILISGGRGQFYSINMESLMGKKNGRRDAKPGGRKRSDSSAYCSPVPDSGNNCGLPVLLSYARYVADSDPTIDGVK